MIFVLFFFRLLADGSMLQVNESWGNPFLLASLRRNYLKSEVGAKDLRRLKPLDSMSSMDGIDARWVNDEIITAYSVMINSRSDDEDVRMKKVGDENRNDGLLKAFCFTSFFYCKINGTANPKGVERWTKHVSLTSGSSIEFFESRIANRISISDIDIFLIDDCL